MLKKGCGLCHGVAGNAYAFLCKFKHDPSDKTALHRAMCFTRIILSQGVQQCCAHADHPMSLFEGLAGTAQFALDMLATLDFLTDNDLIGLQNWQFLGGLLIF